MPVYLQGGKVLLNAGQVAISADCCCDTTCCSCLSSKDVAEVTFSGFHAYVDTGCIYGSTPPFFFVKDTKYVCSYNVLNATFGLHRVSYTTGLPGECQAVYAIYGLDLVVKDYKLYDSTNGTCSNLLCHSNITYTQAILTISCSAGGFYTATGLFSGVVNVFKSSNVNNCVLPPDGTLLGFGADTESYTTACYGDGIHLSQTGYTAGDSNCGIGSELVTTDILVY